MGERDRDTIVRALLAEMKAKLISRAPDNYSETDASILLFSNILTTFAAEPALPEITPWA